jgi:Zn-dependent protease with chaperone function
VHTLLALSSILLVVLGGFLALRMLRRLDGWSQRRSIQLLVLAAPVLSLSLGIAAVHHFAGRTCFVGGPPWDYVVGLALPFLMGLGALGGLGLGLVRLVLMYRVITRSGIPVNADLQTLADRLAQRLGAPNARVLLCTYHRPLAVAYGVWRPTVLLSTWMVENLDQRELESVLAHELSHVARRDYLIMWFATVLRDAFFYLPTSWSAYRQLQHEKELACDEIAVRTTDRPLALASALGKVWQYALGQPVLASAQYFVGTGEPIEGRIERLLAIPGQDVGSPWVNPHSRLIALGLGTSALVGLLTLGIANVTLLLAAMGCGPASLLGRLF